MIAIVVWLPPKSPESFIQSLVAHCLAPSRPSVRASMNNWLVFFPTDIMPGTQQILYKGM